MGDGHGYIVAAYTVTWVVLGGYAAYLARIVRRSRRARDAARTITGEAGAPLPDESIGAAP